MGSGSLLQTFSPAEKYNGRISVHWVEDSLAPVLPSANGSSVLTWTDRRYVPRADGGARRWETVGNRDYIPPIHLRI